MMAYFVSNVGEHRYIDGINHSNTWTKKQWTFRTGTNPNQSGIIRFDHKGSIDGQNCILKTRFVKLEKGNKPTDWTPAPEDLDAQFQNLQNGINGVQNNVNTLQNGISNIQASLGDIKTKTDNFTSIQGGLVSSNIISVGSTQVNQNAFISGITDAGGLSVRFGAGANYANKNNAPFRVLDNGKMIAENAEISGNIDARSGKIGNFEISEGWLSTGNKDTWARGNSANFTDQSLFIREVGNRTEDIREIRMGITAPLSTGIRGATVSIKNNMNETPEFAPNSLVENISLQLEAKNGKDNIALDILNGGIRIDGEKGVTNVIRIVSNINKVLFSNQYNVLYTDIKIKNGIIVSVSNATGSF